VAEFSTFNQKLPTYPALNLTQPWITKCPEIHKKQCTGDLLRSQSRRVWSHEPESANCPSDDRITSDTKWPWPWSDLCGTP